jgi:hypothetical protein
VLVANLPQLVPIDLAPLAATMALYFRFGFLVRSRGVFRLIGSRRGQIKQMTLPFAFAEPFSPSTKRPTFVPGQFVQRGSVLLFEFFKRGSRFVQDTVQFRRLLIRFGRTLLGLLGTLLGFFRLLLKLHRLLIGGQQKIVAFGQVVRQ